MIRCCGSKDSGCLTHGWFGGAPAGFACVTDRARAARLWDRCILGATLPASTGAPTSAHHCDRRCTSAPRTVGSPPCWPDAPGTLAPSIHRPANTSYRSIPPRSPQLAVDTPRDPSGSMRGHWASLPVGRQALLIDDLIFFVDQHRHVIGRVQIDRSV